MVNRVTLIGRLGKDPELRRLDSGAVVAQFTIATHESYKDKDGVWQELTEWHNIVAWRALAEQAERLFKKGSLVYIEGKLTHRKYMDASQVERYVTEVVANGMRSLEKREGSGAYAPAPMSAENEPPARQSFGGNEAASPQMSTTDAPPPSEEGGDLPF